MAPEYYYVFTGKDGEWIPRHITHVLIAAALKFVPANAFYDHPNIEEVICHDGVEKIEEWAFYNCPRLRRVIMPGVKEVEKYAFNECKHLLYIECGKLEVIGAQTFRFCESLSSIDLPSIKIVESRGFCHCINLTNVNFGNDLESIGTGAFDGCTSLERIALPLKGGIITHDTTFFGCEKLSHVDLIGGVHETIDALLMDVWKDDLNNEIGKISQILDTTPAGNFYLFEAGEKTQAIQTWIRSILRKIIDYKAEHRRYLNVAAATLQPALPNDIVLKNVFPFIQLPSFRFQGEN